MLKNGKGVMGYHQKSQGSTVISERFNPTETLNYVVSFKDRGRGLREKEYRLLLEAGRDKKKKPYSPASREHSPAF
jgi:hypothetical protein